LLYGIYTVNLSITTDHHCQSQATYNQLIHVFKKPEPYFSYYPNPVTQENPEVHFSGSSYTPNTYCTWNFGDGSPLVNYCDPIHVYSQPGYYNVIFTTTDVNGCDSSISQTISYDAEVTVYLPNAFTPDGNMNNDYFGPKGYYIEPTDYLMLIYDRWGDEIYKTTELDKPWDGRVKGSSEIAQVGVYVYYIRLRDFNHQIHEFRGYVTLLKKD